MKSVMFSCRMLFNLRFLGVFGSLLLPINTILMSQDQLIQLKHKGTGQVYWTRKNKKLVTRKIELKKYDPKTRKHVVFKETKK